MKTKTITWTERKVKLSLIDPTPKNYKIKSDLGRERLATSLARFGLAGSIVCVPSPDKRGRFMVVDGNSRLERIKETSKDRVLRSAPTISVSLPSRPLTKQEFTEMSALFDFAKAGEVDLEGIEKDLGSKKDFFERWGLNVPLHLLDKVGRASSVAVVQGGAAKGKKAMQEEKLVRGSEMRLVQLTFDEAQERKFRELEAKLIKKWGTKSTMETVLKAMQYAVHGR